MYEMIANFVPQFLLKVYKRLFIYAGLESGFKRIVGFLLSFSIALSVSLSYAFYVFLALDTLQVFISVVSVFALFQIIVYTLFWLAANSRAQYVDDILPDALQLVVINLRSGMTVDKAVMASVKPEFGPLEQALERFGKEIIAGSDIKEALTHMSLRINSKLLQRTVSVIIKGLESGGELATLLEETGEDIRETRILRSEIKSSVLTYAIFIFFASAFGAPLVFGVSTYLVEVLSVQMSKFSLGSTANIEGVPSFIRLGTTTGVSTEFLILYSGISLVVTAIFASLIIGLIKDGNEKKGIVYAPIIVILSLAVFLITRMLVSSIFVL